MLQHYNRSTANARVTRAGGSSTRPAWTKTGSPCMMLPYSTSAAENPAQSQSMRCPWHTCIIWLWHTCILLLIWLWHTCILLLIWLWHTCILLLNRNPAQSPSMRCLNPYVEGVFMHVIWGGGYMHKAQSPSMISLYPYLYTYMYRYLASIHFVYVSSSSHDMHVSSFSWQVPGLNLLCRSCFLDGGLCACILLLIWHACILLLI